MTAPSTIAGLGARGDHVATVPHLDPARLTLCAEEQRVLALVGRVARIEEVLARSGLSEPRAIATLLALRAKGAIVPARVVRRAVGPVAPVDAALAEEVDLPAERKREILELERTLDSLHLFAVLGLQPGASPEQVKRAYYDAARRYHPDCFYGKNLGSYRARMERIFRRMSEAQAVLSDPARRAAWLQQHPALVAADATAQARAAQAAAASSASSAAALAAPLASLPPASPVESDARRSERQARLARHPYLALAQTRLDAISRGRQAIARGEFERAYTEMHQALARDPQNRELQALLAEARRRHEAQRARAELERGVALENQRDLTGAYQAYRRAQTLDAQSAEAAFRAARVGLTMGQEGAEVRRLAQTAVDLAPDNLAHRLLLAQVLLEGGDRKGARNQYEAVLKRDPTNAEARAQTRNPWWPF